MSDEAARQKAEEGRVEAEEERVEHEVERRVAEGGEQALIIGEEKRGSLDVEQSRVEAEARRAAAEAARALAEEKRGSLRAFYAKLATFVALPIAFLALLPAIVGLYLVGQRADENRRLIEQNAETRAQLVRGLKRADIITCREVEELKTQARTAAILTFTRLEETLGLLELQSTPEIVAAAERNRDEALVRNAPRDCGKLPPKLP